MNKYAVFHILDTPYAYGKDKDTLIVRVRVARNDIKNVIFIIKIGMIGKILIGKKKW